MGEIYLSAGERRFRLQNGVFSRCGPPHLACGAMRHLRSSSVSDGGSNSSRCRSRFHRDATAFSCDSFSPRSSGPACVARLSELHGWLETPCAFQLGEPNHDGVTSDILCRTTALKKELQLLHSPRICVHFTLRWNPHPSSAAPEHFV